MRATMFRLLPIPLLTAMRRLMLRVSVPSAGGRPCVPGDARVTLVGYLSSPTGLGQGARLCARALVELGFTVGLIDVSPLLDAPGGVTLPAEAPGIVHGDIGGPLLCHVNPPDFQAVLFRLRLSGRARTLIAHWVWELPVVGRVWRDAFRLVHEAWVPSAFVADALRASGFAGPIRLVAYPIRAPEHAPAPPSRPRGMFTVLTVFAFESGFDRKNPLGAIAAFRAAFADHDDARLIIKTRGRSLSGEPERRLADAVAGAANVTVIDGEFDDDAMAGLLERSDVLLSLHRSEGFGLPLAEAMMAGKPVIATAWSGNLDFMRKGCACLVPAELAAASDETPVYDGLRARWADPSQASAANWLRRLRDDRALREAIGQAGRAMAMERLGIAAYAAAIAPALGAGAPPAIAAAAPSVLATVRRPERAAAE
jgi:glycosyltransferase involved in cell wall biosynthesis